jgi:hypothetical protein
VAAASNTTLSGKEIQGLESQRRNAKLFNHPEIENLTALMAICNTLCPPSEEVNMEEINNLPPEGIYEFLERQVEMAIGAPRAKIIPASQLNPNDTTAIAIHRKGLMALTKGLAQSEAIFSPNTTVSGVHPTMVNLESILESSAALCSVLGINLLECLKERFDPLYTTLLTNKERKHTTLGDIDRAVIYIAYILNFEALDFVGFAERTLEGPPPTNLNYLDGHYLTTHEDNITTLEEDIVRSGAANITRTGPPNFGEVPLGTKSPLAALAAKQLDLAKKQLKSKPKTPPTTSKDPKGPKKNKTNKKEGSKEGEGD